MPPIHNTIVFLCISIYRKIQIHHQFDHSIEHYILKCTIGISRIPSLKYNNNKKQTHRDVFMGNFPLFRYILVSIPNNATIFQPIIVTYCYYFPDQIGTNPLTDCWLAHTNHISWRHINNHIIYQTDTYIMMIPFVFNLVVWILNRTNASSDVGILDSEYSKCKGWYTDLTPLWQVIFYNGPRSNLCKPPPQITILQCRCWIHSK